MNQAISSRPHWKKKGTQFKNRWGRREKGDRKKETKKEDRKSRQRPFKLQPDHTKRAKEVEDPR